jgi:hypothetical protein
LYLKWSIWEERNMRSFEDCKILMMFKSLSAWMTAYSSPRFYRCNEFLDFCSSFLPHRGSLLYTSCVHSLRLTAVSKKTIQEKRFSVPFSSSSRI